MQNKNKVSRRKFLSSSGMLAGATFLRVAAPSLAAIAQTACTARDQQRAFTVLGEREAADFEAIAARLIPTTDTPGASEAGVIHFFDRAFVTEMAGLLESARDGLAAFNASLARNHPGSESFAALDPDEQDDFLRVHESGDFFNLCWEMTIVGFFSMSKYGGNKNHVGWDLIGFEGDHGAWEYPFGHYDAEYIRKQSDGE